jgi:CBS domain-containing protein
MNTVGDILDSKGHAIHSIRPSATVYQAVSLMGAHHVGALLVCTDDGVVGILSERDVMRRVVLERRDPRETTVASVMTREVVCVPSRATIREAMAIMTERRCRHLPVVDDGLLEGMISIGDLVHAVTRDQLIEIRQLTEYICGWYPG